MEINKGLNLIEEPKLINGKTFILRTLISDDGYCFYDSDEQVEIPTYFNIAYLGASLSKLSHEDLTKRFVSILETEKNLDKEE